MSSGPLAITITGPTTVTSAGTHTWSAWVTGGTGSYTFSWSYQYSNQSTATCCTTGWDLSLPISGSGATYVDIGVNVTDAAGTRTYATTRVYLNIPVQVSVSGPSLITVKTTATYSGSWSSGGSSQTYAWYTQTCINWSCSAWSLALSGSTSSSSGSSSIGLVVSPQSCAEGDSKLYMVKLVVTRTSDGNVGEGVKATQLCPAPL